MFKQYSMVILTLSALITGCGGGNDSDSKPTPQGNVVAAIELDQLPNNVTYNRATTPDGYVEFNWSITFDINGDGTINQGDVTLRLMHFKQPGSLETTGPISDFDAQLWLYTSNTQFISVASATKRISGNTITLTIDKSAHPSLSQITETTLVYFKTSIRDDITQLPKYDYFPDLDTYVDIPLNKQFTDPLGDVTDSEIDMINMSIAY